MTILSINLVQFNDYILDIKYYFNQYYLLCSDFSKPFDVIWYQSMFVIYWLHDAFKMYSDFIRTYMYVENWEIFKPDHLNV